MKIHKCLAVMTAFFFLTTLLNCAVLKLVRSIGSDDDNYMFMWPIGGVTAKNNDIYVIDFKGHFIARYNKNGTFIKKIGRRGKGPQDFNGPQCLNILDNTLYVFDGFNRRVAEVDLELNSIIFHKIYGNLSFTGDFFMLNKNNCVGKSVSIDEEHNYNALKMLNLDTQQPLFFFPYVPVPEFQHSKKLFQNATYISRFSPCMGLDRKNKQLIISFDRPNNPIEFFVYSYRGECIDRFNYTFDIDYKYPDFIIEGKLRPDKKYTSMFLGPILVYKGHYIVQVTVTKYTGYRNFDSESTWLIFDANTKKLKTTLPVPKYFEPFSISRDGFVVATQNFEDIPKVYIYKFEL